MRGAVLGRAITSEIAVSEVVAKDENDVGRRGLRGFREQSEEEESAEEQSIHGTAEILWPTGRK